MTNVRRMRVSTGTVIGATFLAVVTLGACGGGNPTAAPPSTVKAISPTTAPRSHTGPSITTIPTLPPTTKAPPTTQATTTTHPSTTTSSTTTPSTTVPATTTTVPPTTVPAASAQPCTTLNLTAGLTNGSGAAGTFYYDLVFTNGGSTSCTMFGYPGVSYVRGDGGTQTGDPAVRNATISGESSPTVVTLAPGGTAHAVVAEVDIANYPPTTCRPVEVRGLRVYPPDQSAALFVPQPTRGCLATGVRQLGVGFVVP